jgi:probable phosphoglycerate mutase
VVPVRHGETEWSVAQKHTGRTDVPLTDRGREQARALGARLAGREFALVLSSPLQRALETCRLAGLGDRLEVVDDLAEWDYGDYDGLTTAEIRSQHPDWDLWRDGCPGGETPDQVGARADRVVARVRDAGGDCALFAHGHVLRVLAARWIEEAPAHGARLGLSTATLSTLGREHERRVIWLWNDASHLNSPAPPVDR